MSEKLRTIPVDKIVDNCEMLRGVDRSNPKFVSLVGSIRADGLMSAITVIVDPDTEGQYILVDGKQRLTACRDLNHSEINCVILDAQQQDVLMKQIIANSQNIETRPVEYSRALVKIISASPMMTRTQLAAKLNHDANWLNERLGLLNLTDEIAILVDEGKIGLSNAYVLAKLAAEDQSLFVEDAMTMAAGAFSVKVVNYIRQIAKAKRAARPPGPPVFEPVEHLRKKREIILGPEDINALFAENNITEESTKEDVFTLALKWVLQVDAAGVAEQKAKSEQRAAEAKLQQEAAKSERLEIARRVREEMARRQKERDALEASQGAQQE